MQMPYKRTLVNMEVFKQGTEGTYRDMLLVSHAWHLDLNRLAVPIFLWHETADTMVPVSVAKAFSKILPGCELHFVEGAGYQLLWSKDIWNQIISKMISGGITILQ